MNMVVRETNCPDLNMRQRGKVRDVFDLGEHLLLVATDRLSAFDVVSTDPIPGKGRILTQMSAFWFDWLAGNVPWLRTHFVTVDWDQMCGLHPKLKAYRDQLEGRSMLVKKLERIFPVEFIPRDYLYGSSLKNYLATGQVCGITLPPGMKKADKLPVTMFTLSTKAKSGHDENISLDEAIKRGLLTPVEATALAGLATLLLMLANGWSVQRGIIIPDTKFEFGTLDGQIYLADEVLTPDSSRFWPANGYVPGQDQPSFDKQFVREYLEAEVTAGRWDKTDPMPKLPPEIIEGTAKRYREALQLLCNVNIEE